MLENLNQFFRHLGIEKLQEHYHWLIASFIVCHCLYLSAWPISHRLSKSFRAHTFIKKREWAIHVVSFSHATIISILAFPILADPVLAKDPVFGYSFYAATVYAIACGYFLWDSYICALTVKTNGVGFLIHGVSCFFVFLFCFRPFLMFYGGFFLMFELSTPFLNIIWFTDKTNRSGSRLQIFAGICLIIAFFCSRILGGLYYGAHFYYNMYVYRNEIPFALLITYSFLNMVLNSLNLLWFYKIIKQAGRRLKGQGKKAKKEN